MKRTAAALALFAPAALTAGTASESSTSTPLEPLIVTASRTRQTPDDALAPVTVITRADIERQQAPSVPTLLRGLPGVSVATNGGPGQTTFLFLRGTNPDHVLVLIDGVRVGSASTGYAAFEQLPIEQIERIEIVRGPRSSLYGSEALGGVIQIFTRRGADGLHSFASAGGGSRGTYDASAGVSGSTGPAWFSLSGSAFGTDGFNACAGRPFPDGAGCFTDEPDNDAHRTVSGAARAGYRFANGLELEGQLLRATADTEFDSSVVNEARTLQQVGGAALRLAPVSVLDLTLAVGQSRDEVTNARGGVDLSYFATERTTASAQGDLALAPRHLLTLGVDALVDRVTASEAFDRTSRTDTGYFAQYQGGIGAHEVQVSLRHDDNEQFGGRTTYGAAWGWSFSEVARLTFSYGTAFKAPTFNALYYPGFGNPALQPETSRSAEVELSARTGWGRWSVNVYDTRIEDLIAFDASLQPANVDEAHIRGVEIAAQTRIALWDASGSLTLLDPRNRSDGPARGRLLTQRPRTSARLDLDRAFGACRLGATLIAAGKGYDDLANSVELGSYVTLDLRAEYQVARDLRLQLRVENVFDEDYHTVAFFNQPGRGAYVTLRWQH